MVKGTLSNGFKFKVPKNTFKDLSYLKAATKYKKDTEDWDLFENLLTITLGEEQKVKFVESFMDKDGLVPVDVLIQGYKEMVNIVTNSDEEIKN